MQPIRSPFRWAGMDTLGPSLLKLVEIVWINIVLSGDNAVVIAMACRGLPPKSRRKGLVLGAGVAVILRIAFTVLVASLLATPFLKIIGSLLLLWIATTLLVEESERGEIAASDRLWQAVRTVAVADAVMSLDNVLAIAAVAEGSLVLLGLGLLISIPLIVAGATLIMALLARWPILVFAGAALLGFVAGDMFVSDPWLAARIGSGAAERLDLPASLAGAALVLVVGWLRRRAAAP